MNKIFKYLGAFAIAGALGLQTMNVNAADACEGKVTYTDYYLFLGVDGIDGIKSSVAAHEGGSGNYTQYNAANKANNIKGATIITNAEIEVTKDGGSASGALTWSYVEYWKKWYTAQKNKDENLVYFDRENNERYMLHNNYDVYTNGFDDPDSVETITPNHTGKKGLGSYIGENLAAVEAGTDDLITKGTYVPDTDIFPPTDLESNVQPEFKWKVQRTFLTSDKANLPEGVLIYEGDKKVYTPAVYMVTYCKNAPYTLRYDDNVDDDSVTNMPDPIEEEFESSIVVSNTVPKRDGYTFKGWSTKVGATKDDTPTHKAGDSIRGESVTLYAIWTPDEAPAPADGTPFTVTYDANGGKNAPATQSGKKGEACVTISTQKPTLTGNTFLGWSTNKDAREPDKRFNGGSKYCGDEGSVVLYAVWQSKTGISAHVVAFGAVAIIATTALIVAKKKNLFRQI